MYQIRNPHFIMTIVRHRFWGLFFPFFFLAGCFSLTVNAQSRNDSGKGLNTVVIDPGHGGRDPGAVGARSKEKDIVLDISLKVGNMITDKYPDVKVIYTRKTDVFVELDKRGDIANKAHADLFISIHANANPKKSPYGTETFVMGNSRSAENMEVAKRENSVILIEDDYSERYEGFDPNSSESYIYFSLLQNAYQNQSLSFAAEIQDQFKILAKRADRGVKQANFLVLWKTTMPSVLVEVGFISNTEEEKYLISKEGKERLAESVFRAFCIYKTKIEDRSSFRSSAHANGKSASATESPAAKADPVVEFCVQIATSSKPMDTNPNNFKKHKNVERVQMSADFYKYIVGRTKDYAAVQETLEKERVDFKDAFIVGIVDGKIIPVGEALKLMK